MTAFPSEATGFEGALAHLVDVLLDQLPGADRAILSDIVNGLALNNVSARTLADFLKEHRDALRSGRSDGPASRLRLLDRLGEAFPDQVERARCVRCGRTGLLNRRMDGQRGCGACYSKSHARPCVRCGQLGKPVWREDGGTVCAYCANRDRSRWEPCSGCGKTARVVSRPAGRPLCQTCAPKPLYTCSSCRRTGQRAHVRTAAGPICDACYHRQKVAECSRCQRVSPYVSRRPDTGTYLCWACWQPTPIRCTRCGELKIIKRCRGGTPVCESCRSATRSMRPCVECGRARKVHSRLVMGDVCGSCYTRLRNHPAACSMCHEVRPLIGRDEAARRICGPCAGEQRSWTCISCGRFAALYSDGQCPICVARRRVHDLTSGQNGQIHPQLRSLVEALDIEGNPRSVISWLHQRKWAEQLGDLARQNGKITHRTLDELPQTRHVIYLRQVLVHVGVLPGRDEDIDGTLPWLDNLLRSQPASIASVIRPYAHWSVLRRARQRRNIANNRSARKYARTRISLAIQFLNWLDSRSTSLSGATQTDVDTWLTEGTTTRYRLRDFLLWAHARDLCSSLEIPWPGREEPEDFLTDETRWQMLRRCIHDEAVPAHLRAAGGLLLFYGMTPTRIVQLRASDITTRGERTYVHLGRSPVILPERLAELVSRIVADSARHVHGFVATAKQPDPWLFPGAAPGTHARAGWMSQQLTEQLGIFVRISRNTALCALAEDLPAPVLADLFHVHITTAVRWTKLVKRDWAKFVATRRPPKNAPNE
jgi:hypothetical protein